MELPLIYSTEKFSSVKVGILTIEVSEILSSLKLHVSGDMPFHILASVCEDTKPSDFEDISLVDAQRIIFKAWIQTHGGLSNYMAKTQCECGRVCITNHDINCKYIKPDIYDKKHIIKSIDTKTYESKDCIVELKPTSLRSHTNVLLKYAQIINESSDTATVELIKNVQRDNIKTIDGKKDFTSKEIPTILMAEILKITSTDIQATSDMIMKKINCSECKKELFSTVGWYDSEFLQS